MSIASQTTIQAYQLNKGGTPARMTILRMIAADSVNNRNPDTRLQPGDWRGARHWKLNSYAAAYGHGLNQGLDNDSPVWYAHNGEQFRKEKDAQDIASSISGHYTDVDGDDCAYGIVASLPHGRFIAGYRWTSNDERVYFPEIFDNADEAARMADEHARVFSESAIGDSEQYNAAREVEDNLEDSLLRLRELIALRHRKCMAYVRDEIESCIVKIREYREELTTTYKNYV